MLNTTPAAILLDLDGTLSDPSVGFVRSVNHALEGLGHPAREAAALVGMIGPPLRASFVELLGSDDTDLIEEAVRLYRERYAALGQFENTAYTGVREMLAALRDGGARLYVATSKMTAFAVAIVTYHGLERFFTGIHGPDAGTLLDNKADLVRHLLAAEGIAPEEAVMVGDRSHDIHAARANGIASIGVTYGFGTQEELIAAGADAIADSPADVVRLVRRITSVE